MHSVTFTFFPIANHCFHSAVVINSLRTWIEFDLLVLLNATVSLILFYFLLKKKFFYWRRDTACNDSYKCVGVCVRACVSLCLCMRVCARACV